jgi:hypothetical protein
MREQKNFGKRGSESAQTIRHTRIGYIYMSYAVSPGLCLPKNATAEFLIRFIQPAVEIAETENLGKLKWWGGEVGLCSSP